MRTALLNSLLSCPAGKILATPAQVAT